ncbi:MAG TPA: hypothetical protein VMV69_04615 [Pirellulales bacterium]|nr:hypothetical protein [Pirellulales bacterium]
MPGSAQCVGWLSIVKDQLCAIERLTPGWDSNGADSPDPRLLRAAWNLLECLCEESAIPKPHVNPTRRGGVQFEWEKGPRYFELEVDSERSAAYFFDDEIAQTESEGRISVGDPLEPILKFVQRVAEGD